MQSAVVMFARKPPLRQVLKQPRRPWRRLLARRRDQIAILRMIDLDHATIGKAMRITDEDVRALSPKTNKSARTARVTRHAIRALVRGRHAHLGGRTIPIRAKNLVTIASAYSWDELVEEPGIGPATATEIQLWLEERGSSLRDDDSRLRPAQ